MCDKIEYLSEAVANNAVELHKLSAPGCATYEAYACGDHFHCGHSGLNAEEHRLAEACKAEHPFRALPFRRRMHRRARRVA